MNCSIYIELTVTQTHCITNLHSNIVTLFFVLILSQNYCILSKLDVYTQADRVSVYECIQWDIFLLHSMFSRWGIFKYLLVKNRDCDLRPYCLPFYLYFTLQNTLSFA